MLQLLSVLVVASIATGCVALITSMIRGSSGSILKALAGDLYGHNVTLLPLRPRQRAAKTTIPAYSIRLRAAA
jgi:hypothetical protein